MDANDYNYQQKAAKGETKTEKHRITYLKESPVDKTGYLCVPVFELLDQKISLRPKPSVFHKYKQRSVKQTPQTNTHF